MNKTLENSSFCHQDATTAIAFFGLMRNARIYTFSSIAEKILAPLEGADIFVHSFSKTEDKGVMIDVLSDVEKFQPCVQRLDSSYPFEIQEASRRVEEKTNALISMYHTQHLPLSPTGYNSKTLQNWMSSRYSINALSSMIRDREVVRGRLYERIVLARPDLMYRTSIPWQLTLKEDVVAVPNFHHCTGINDRFAFGSRSAMLKYMFQYKSLFSDPSRILFNRSIRSTEAQLCQHLISQGLKVELFSACFARMRGDGSVARPDFYQTPQLPHECIQAGMRHLDSSTDWDCACECKFVRSNCSPSVQLPVMQEVVRSISPMVAELIVYTTVLFNEPVTPLSYRAWKYSVPGVRYVAFVSPFVARTFAVEDYGFWMYVVIQSNSSMRTLSKIIKTSPSVFFPRAKYFLYLDFKLKLNVNPLNFVRFALFRSMSDTVLIRHPCTSFADKTFAPCGQKRRHTAKEWILAEVEQVARRNRTENATSIYIAAKKHTNEALHRSEYDYADTAIVVQRNSHTSRRFMCAWFSQMMQDKSDRDQISLFRVLQAFSERQVGFLESVAPLCVKYCSWWEKGSGKSVAILTDRTKNK